MNDWESTHQITEELKNLRTTVRRFGIYFVILSLIPFLWALFVLFMMGSLLGGVTSGTARGISESASQPSKSYAAQTQLQRQQLESTLATLARDMERLQQKLESNASNPRPANNPTWMRKMPSN